MNNPTIPTKAHRVFSGKIFDVYQWEQKLYDGSLAIFEALDRSDTVHTIGILPDERILLVYDEQPHRQGVLTPPGGKIDDGETPVEAAKREFLEETGYSVGKLIPWHEYQMHSKIDWIVHAFIGQDLIKESEPALEAGERIAVRTYTFNEFLQLGRSPLLRDKTLRIMLLEALLDPMSKANLVKLFYG